MPFCSTEESCSSANDAEGAAVICLFASTESFPTSVSMTDAPHLPQNLSMPVNADPQLGQKFMFDSKFNGLKNRLFGPVEMDGGNEALRPDLPNDLGPDGANNLWFGFDGMNSLRLPLVDSKCFRRTQTRIHFLEIKDEPLAALEIPFLEKSRRDKRMHLSGPTEWRAPIQCVHFLVLQSVQRNLKILFGDRKR